METQELTPRLHQNVFEILDVNIIFLCYVNLCFLGFGAIYFFSVWKTTIMSKRNIALSIKKIQPKNHTVVVYDDMMAEGEGTVL